MEEGIEAQLKGEAHSDTRASSSMILYHDHLSMTFDHFNCFAEMATDRALQIELEDAAWVRTNYTSKTCRVEPRYVESPFQSIGNGVVNWATTSFEGRTWNADTTIAESFKDVVAAMTAKLLTKWENVCHNV
eukprot:2664739-Amphidinium_carterae.1